MTFTLAIVGRPNVGKSTLFNRLVGKKLAIVNDQPGVTRDWREAEGTLFGRTFKIIDPAGLEEKFADSIPARMRKQTEAALKRADAALFLIDGREGVTAMDQHFADWLRKQKKPILLGVNKCEHDPATHSGMAEAYSLGLGEPMAISAEHGIGLEHIFYALEPFFPDEVIVADEDIQSEALLGDLDAVEGDDDFVFQQEEDTPEKTIKVAIVGRPNAGKSTLLNAIVGEERSMAGPEAGITRDAVAIDWTFKDRPFRLVDTAGMRRKSRIFETLEKLSVEDSLRAIRLAQVVILVLDMEIGIEKQDIQIADLVLREGRALVIAANKWDAIRDHKKVLEELIYQTGISLAQVKEIPLVTLSALQGNNIEKLLDAVLTTYAVWNKRVKTSGLNRWLAAMESRNPPPIVQGRPNRLKYIAQIKTRPPTFALWVSRAPEMPEQYKRYIINGLREKFDIPGVPVRLLIRKSKNPFMDKKSGR